MTGRATTVNHGRHMAKVDITMRDIAGIRLAVIRPGPEYIHSRVIRDALRRGGFKPMPAHVDNAYRDSAGVACGRIIAKNSETKMPEEVAVGYRPIWDFEEISAYREVWRVHTA